MPTVAKRGAGGRYLTAQATELAKLVRALRAVGGSMLNRMAESPEPISGA